MTATHLSPEEVERIALFMGYGHSTAPVWFIGLEEGVGSALDGDTMFNLTARGAFRAEMDLAEAHLLLREAGRPVAIETKRTFTQVWTWMAKLMRAHRGYADWSCNSAAKTYVRERLGRSDAKTFLTELSPWPRRRLADRPS